jgi:hypothetical protein
LAGTAIPRILADPFGPVPRTFLELHDFPLASEDFREALVAQLVTAIEAEITRHVGYGPEQRWAALLAATHARTLLPEAWRPTLAKLPELLPEVAGPHCQSCSVTLDKHHVLETTDRYCRYCSEPDGHLKSRAEVHRLIAGWFARWQSGVALEEPQRRAEFFMGGDASLGTELTAGSPLRAECRRPRALIRWGGRPKPPRAPSFHPCTLQGRFSRRAHQCRVMHC